jgi:branched-chain amino acid transport system permease protein
MRERSMALGVFAALALLPLVVQDAYFLHLLILILLWVSVGVGWNILAGYTGQVSFSAAAFFGIGSYAAGLLMHKLGLSAWWGLLVGPLAAVILALPFGALTFPLRGAYFALGSLALGEVMRHVTTIWESFTEGMMGILIMQTFVSKVPYYYIALGLAAVSLLLVEVVLRTKLGYYFISIREDQDAAASLGINVTRFKMISLFFHAALTGLAGALYMCYMGFIDPHVVFSLHDISIMAILVTIVGGVGTIYGPVVGAFIMVTVQEVFRSAGFGSLKALAKSLDWSFLEWAIKYVTQAHALAFGLLVVVVIMVMPNGLVGDWGRIKAFFHRARS